jgi:surface antigen Omp85-like protein
MALQHRYLGAAAILAGAVLLPQPTRAQDVPPPATVRVVPGANYAAGGLRRFFLGDHYRDTWGTEIEVPYLDLKKFAGGLTAISAHTGSQTTSLRMLGADGRRYQFRGVFKNPTNILRPELQGTLIADLLQDGASASHPVGALVVSPLLEAVGVLHPAPTLAIMPDDPSLGEFQESFRGLLGIIEERPNEADESGAGGFGDALNVIGPERLFDRIDESPDDLVNARSFLTARMMDILIGDRDRHRDNWRWALMVDEGAPRVWEPISRDHDEAFVNADGVLIALAMEFYPQIVSFGPTYPNLLSLNWHAREVDRRYLVGLDAAVWDSVAVSVQERLTDEVIADAVRALPPEMYEVGGATLETALRNRRDLLRVETQSYYRMLAEEVEIHATNAAERAEIVRVDDRFVDLTLSAEGRVYLHRRFDAQVTREIRVDMWGGKDVVEVSGEGDAPIEIRVIGGKGADRLLDRSTRGGVRFYDAGSNTEWEGRRSSLNSKPFPAWVGSDLDRYPPREWGTWNRRMGWVSAGPDYGLLATAGLRHTNYGFRKRPYSSDWTLTIGLASGEGWGQADFNGDFRLENSGVHLGLEASISGIELLKFHGIGNDTEGSGRRRRFNVPFNQFFINPTLEYEVGDHLELRAGPWVKGSSSDADDSEFFRTVSDTLYGAGRFGQVGVNARIRWDTRDRLRAPSQGVYLNLEGRAAPSAWSVRDAYTVVSAEARTYLSWDAEPFRPILALRVGGETSSGRLPFQEAAYVGGRSKLRGWSSDRFAGDASLYGGVELRTRLTGFTLMVPGDMGVFGLVDGARVYSAGESPGGWHMGYGGGLWFSFLDPDKTLTFTLAGGEERAVFYLGLGFAY